MLEIEIKPEPGHHVVKPRGDLDLGTQLQFKQAINELVDAGHVHLVVDLDETAFLDSIGLGALIGARRKVLGPVGSFAIVCNNPALLKLFRITTLDEVFEIRSTV